MEIRSKFTVTVPSYFVKALGLNSESKITAAFQNGQIVLNIASQNPLLPYSDPSAHLHLDQEEWIRAGFISDSRKGQSDAYLEGYKEGYNTGHGSGFDAGYRTGEADGYSKGYWNGYQDGENDEPYDDALPLCDEENSCCCNCQHCPLDDE